MKDLTNNKSISFEEYIEAFAEYKNVKSKDPDETTEVNGQWQEVHRNFKNENGEIINKYICSHSKASVMVCQKKKKNFFSFSHTSFLSQYELGNHPEIERLLIEIDFLAVESSRLLRGKNLKKCLSLIYKVAKNTMGILDSVKDKNLENVGDDEKMSEMIEMMKHNLWHAKKYHERAAKFTAQMDYFTGNLIGFFVLVLAVLGFGLYQGINMSSCFVDGGVNVSCIFYFGIIAGSIGAMISVMNRISSGNLQLNYEPDSKTIRMIGIIRPLIGGVFGVIILLLFNSGFSIFSLTTDVPLKVISNFIILGFIAGFFERFVPDILDQTREKILNNKMEVNEMPNVEEEVDEANNLNLAPN